jgi:hypothetical protein
MPVDEDKLAEAAAAEADSEEEAHELIAFAKPTSMMGFEELLVMFAKVLREDKKAQIAHTDELKRYNDTLELMAKNWRSVVDHAIGCLNRVTNATIEAVRRPYVFVPLMVLLGFTGLVVMGQGDRGMDILETVIEKYLDVDIHGHAKPTEGEG